MKVKKYIGKTINGFKIIDTYAKETENRKKAYKVLLECENCGRMFERYSGVDFEHIKCRCQYVSRDKQPRHFYKVTYNGEERKASELCKEHNINLGTFKGRINSGMTVDEALSKTFTNTCKLCGKTFESTRPHIYYCSGTCKNRANHGKGYWKQPHIATCQNCGSTFETIRDDAKACSKRCGNALDLKARKHRLAELKRIGEYDYSITKEKVYERDGGICQRCGKLIAYDVDCNDDNYPTTDHIIPLAKGGSHTWDNVQLLCRRCNVLKKAN